MAFTHFRSKKRTHTASLTNKIKRRPDRWWEGRFKEVYSEMLKRFERQRGNRDAAGVKSRGERRKKGERGRGREKKMMRGARVFTLVGVWRACSLRRTSQHCCRTLCPSGELLEPCNHECPCEEHTNASCQTQTWYHFNRRAAQKRLVDKRGRAGTTF